MRGYETEAMFSVNIRSADGDVSVLCFETQFDVGIYRLGRWATPIDIAVRC